jgi:hypothetical protein
MGKQSVELVKTIGVSSSANDNLATIVSALRYNLPSCKIILSNERDYFSIVGVVTEKSNANNLGFDEITITTTVTSPTLQFKRLVVNIIDDGVPLGFPLSEADILGFMNVELQKIIQEARDHAINNRFIYYKFNFPKARLLDDLASTNGYTTYGYPKIFLDISLEYVG